MTDSDRELTPKSLPMKLRMQLSLWNTEGGGLNESFNSFLTRAVIELNSHRRAGCSTHHKPFPLIREGEAGGSDDRLLLVLTEHVRPKPFLSERWARV